MMRPHIKCHFCFIPRNTCTVGGGLRPLLPLLETTVSKQPCWDLITRSRVVVRNATGGPIALRGKQLTDLELWRLARSIDGSELEVQPGSTGGPNVAFTMVGTSSEQGPYSRPSYHVIKHQSDADKTNLTLHNHGYYLGKDYRGDGHAWAAVALQALTAHRLGFRRIVVMATGRSPFHISASLITGGPSLTERVGTIQWPKMGFDAPLPSDFFIHAPPHELQLLGITRNDRISKLMATQKGTELWANFGVDTTMTLELYPASNGARTLLTWAAKRPLHL